MPGTLFFKLLIGDRLAHESSLLVSYARILILGGVARDPGLLVFEVCCGSVLLVDSSLGASITLWLWANAGGRVVNPSPISVSFMLEKENVSRVSLRGGIFAQLFRNGCSRSKDNIVLEGPGLGGDNLLRLLGLLHFIQGGDQLLAHLEVCIRLGVFSRTRLGFVGTGTAIELCSA